MKERELLYKKLILEISILCRCLADKCDEMDSGNTAVRRWVRFLLQKDDEFLKNKDKWNSTTNEIFESIFSGLADDRKYGTAGVRISDYNIDEKIKETLDNIQNTMGKLDA